MFNLVIILFEFSILQYHPQDKVFYFNYFNLFWNLIKPVSFT